MATGDFNGDGLTDVAVASYGAGYVNGTATALLSQLTQTATATASNISPIGTGTHQVEAQAIPETAAMSLAPPALPD